MNDHVTPRMVAATLVAATLFWRLSDFIARNELPPLLEANARGLVILGIHINHSRFDRDHVLSEYQTINTPVQPIEAGQTGSNHFRAPPIAVASPPNQRPAHAASFGVIGSTCKCCSASV